jgi:hypothetical protein
LGGFEKSNLQKTWAIVATSIHKERYTFCLLTGFNPSVIKNIAKGSVFRGHYSNQFDSNDPKLLALALSILQIADLREPIHLDGLALFCNLR